MTFIKRNNKKPTNVLGTNAEKIFRTILKIGKPPEGGVESERGNKLKIFTVVIDSKTLMLFEYKKVSVASVRRMIIIVCVCAHANSEISSSRPTVS